MAASSVPRDGSLHILKRDMLEHLIPEADVAESDHVDVVVSPGEAYAAARHMDTQRLLIARLLFQLRTLPDRLRGAEPERGPVTVDEIVKPGTGFILLEDVPGERFVVGSVGRFWKPDIEFAEVPPESFASFREPGWGKLAWGFFFQPRGERETRITMELRVTATDEESLQHFRRYWRLIGPFSHLIRRQGLGWLQQELGSPEEREQTEPLPGDELLPRARFQVTHGITINAAPEAIWPWLVQMGGRRAGWYSYDWLDNAGVLSADHIIPELQHLNVGDVLPGTPRTDEGFVVERLEPPRILVLSSYTDLTTRRALPLRAPPPKRFFRVSWAFVHEPLGSRTTRLHVRARVELAPEWLLPVAEALAAPIHNFMESRQLRNLKRLAEAHPAAEVAVSEPHAGV